MPSAILPRLRRLCLGFSEAHEVTAWGEPTFRIRNKLFAMYAAGGNHHGDGRASVWIKSTPDNQAFLLRAHPTQLFRPAYVGPAGWIGVYLDSPEAWRLLPALLSEGYELAASATTRTRRHGSKPTARASAGNVKNSPRRSPGKRLRRAAS